MWETKTYIAAYRRDEEYRHTRTDRQREIWNEQQRENDRKADAKLARELKILAGLWLSES